MEKLISCAFNIDTACVELHFTDGSIYSINCTAVENEAADNASGGQSWITSSTTTRWPMPNLF